MSEEKIVGLEKKKRELKRLIAELKDFRGSGTELISVYIPSGYPISEVSNKLRGEYGQAGNIKSKTTRKNVQAALEKIINYLKVFRQTPDNGLAIFCGNVSKDPGKTDIKLFSISPPEPIQISTYRCDSSFLLEPLESIGGRKERYGLVTLDGDEATIGVLEGQVAKVVRRISYTGPSKTQKGGSSALRYDRTVLKAKEEYYSRVGEAMNETLFASGIDKVIIGGPGPIKDIFIKTKPFNYQFKILGVVDVGYVDDYGIQELARKAVDIIAEEQTIKSKKILDKFMKEVVKGGLATYGVKDVIEAVETGRAETLLISEKFSMKLVKLKCKQCETVEERFVEEGQKYACGCGGEFEIIEEKDLFDELFDKAEERGVNVEVISAETSEGAQFLKGFKGIGVILKY
ncbi:MAG: peptide chain release factor aRF-1 [Candidatus Micrarchaeia archaeon]